VSTPPDASGPAFPTETFDPRNGPTNHAGLTKRELFAAMAMQSLIDGATLANDEARSFAASHAVHMADALLAALSAPEVTK